jgi:hypothetical protein
MSTNELPVEKRIAANLSIPESPPVHPEEDLNNSEPDEIRGYPPRTRLLLEGFDPDEITTDFLVAIHDLGDGYDLQVDSISVGRPDIGERTTERL